MGKPSVTKDHLVNIWKADVNNIRFLVQVVYDALPSPINFHIWGKIETLFCSHCSGWGSGDECLLSSCPKASGEGHYRWLRDSIAMAISSIKSHNKSKYIRFHRTRERCDAQPRARSGLLTFATDWKLVSEVNLGRELKIPSRIKSTQF